MSDTFKPRADGRIHIATTGDFPITLKVDGKPVRRVQRVTRADLDGLVSNWEAGGSRDLLLDIDHESMDPDRRTEAAGWVGKLAVDAQGLWGVPRYTPVGEAAVNTGRYRYISPVWSYEQLTGDLVRPVALTSAALTNRPNLKSLQPIANREPTETQPNTPMDEMKQIARKLGLPEDATVEDILDAIGDLQADYAANRDKAKAAARKEAETVAKNRGITDKASIAKFVDLYAENRDTAEQFLALLPVAQGKREGITEKKPGEAAELANRMDSGADEAANRELMRDGFIARIQRERGVDFKTAWERANAEKPELFKS